MGRVGGCQGQAHTYSVSLAKEGLPFSFLDSRRPCSLVLKATGDGSPWEWAMFKLGNLQILKMYRRNRCRRRPPSFFPAICLQYA